jgi:hypothetical protein
MIKSTAVNEKINRNRKVGQEERGLPSQKAMNESASKDEYTFIILLKRSHGRS